MKDTPLTDVRSVFICNSKLAFYYTNKQVCIPVGCLPAASVAATRCQSRGRGLCPCGSLSGGLCLGGLSPQGSLSRWMTNASKDITCSKLRLRVVIIPLLKTYSNNIVLTLIDPTFYSINHVQLVIRTNIYRLSRNWRC